MLILTFILTFCCFLLFPLADPTVPLITSAYGQPSSPTSSSGNQPCPNVPVASLGYIPEVIHSIALTNNSDSEVLFSGCVIGTSFGWEGGAAGHPPTETAAADAVRQAVVFTLSFDTLFSSLATPMARSIVGQSSSSESSSQAETVSTTVMTSVKVSFERSIINPLSALIVQLPSESQAVSVATLYATLPNTPPVGGRVAFNVNIAHNVFQIGAGLQICGSLPPHSTVTVLNNTFLGVGGADPRSVPLRGVGGGQPPWWFMDAYAAITLFNFDVTQRIFEGSSISIVDNVMYGVGRMRSDITNAPDSYLYSAVGILWRGGVRFDSSHALMAASGGGGGASAASLPMLDPSFVRVLRNEITLSCYEDLKLSGEVSASTTSDGTPPNMSPSYSSHLSMYACVVAIHSLAGFIFGPDIIANSMVAAHSSRSSGANLHARRLAAANRSFSVADAVGIVNNVGPADQITAPDDFEILSPPPSSQSPTSPDDNFEGIASTPRQDEEEATPTEHSTSPTSVVSGNDGGTFQQSILFGSLVDINRNTFSIRGGLFAALPPVSFGTAAMLQDNKQPVTVLGARISFSNNVGRATNRMVIDPLNTVSQEGTHTNYNSQTNKLDGMITFGAVQIGSDTIYRVANNDLLLDIVVVVESSASSPSSPLSSGGDTCAAGGWSTTVTIASAPTSILFGAAVPLWPLTGGMPSPPDTYMSTVLRGTSTFALVDNALTVRTKKATSSPLSCGDDGSGSGNSDSNSNIFTSVSNAPAHTSYHNTIQFIFGRNHIVSDRATISFFDNKVGISPLDIFGGVGQAYTTDYSGGAFFVKDEFTLTLDEAALLSIASSKWAGLPLFSNGVVAPPPFLVGFGLRVGGGAIFGPAESVRVCSNSFFGAVIGGAAAGAASAQTRAFFQSPIDSLVVADGGCSDDPIVQNPSATSATAKEPSTANIVSGSSMKGPLSLVFLVFLMFISHF